MPKRNLFILAMSLSLVFILISSAFCADESLTITTYYPSPYGTYNELQLYPHSSPATTCNATTRGTMYYDSDDGQIHVCDGTTWPSIGGGGGYWALSGTNIYNTNTGNVLPDTDVGADLGAAATAWNSVYARYYYVKDTGGSGISNLALNSPSSTTLNLGSGFSIITTPAGANLGIGVAPGSYKLNVGGDVNIGAANVYRRGGIAGVSTSCGAGNTPSGITISGGIVTSAGGCAAIGGGGGGITSINGMFGPAISIVQGSGISISNAGNTVTITNTGGAGGGVTGSGTVNYIPKWTAATTLGNSPLIDVGSNNVRLVGTNLYLGNSSSYLYGDGANLASRPVSGDFYIQNASGGAGRLLTNTVCLSGDCKSAWPGGGTLNCTVASAGACGAMQQIYANCPAGYTLTGGGYALTVYGGPHNAPDASNPNGIVGWHVATGGDGGNCFNAYAVCCRIQ